MRAWIFIFVCLAFTGPLFAQEQMSLRLNEQGILKILRMAIKYNTATKHSRTLIIPQNINKFTISKEKILSYPLIPLVSEISDLNLNKDLDFYLSNSIIKMTGEVNAKSLKANLINSNKDGLDLRLSLELPKIEVSAEKLSLCENKKENSKICGPGLRADLSGITIKTIGRPIILTVVLRLRTNGKVARVSVRSVSSNLEGKKSPSLDIDFKSLEIPKIVVIIGGQEAELDTSRIKNEILKRKSFLAGKLLSFSADFVANDVAQMINRYLANKSVATSYQVLKKETYATFDEFLNNNPPGFYDEDDSVYPQNAVANRIEDVNPFNEMMKKISDLINKAKLKISLKKISTPENKDIELSGLVDMVLNNQQIKIKNSLGNSSLPLPALDMSKDRNHDVNIAISEPLINGALDLVNSTKLFQNIFEGISPVQGFSVKSVKVHFTQKQSLVAVVNAQVDLKELKSTNIKEWFENTIAAWLERNNNNSVIYFPIEISVIPHFVPLPNRGVELRLEVLSPFDHIKLSNRYGYPSNVPKMKESVKEGVMEELRDSLAPYTNKVYNVELSQFLNKSGAVFLPKGLAINQGAYLMMNLDIVDIKFSGRKANLN